MNSLTIGFYAIRTVNFLRLVSVQKPVWQRDVFVDDAPEMLAPVDVVGADGHAEGKVLGVLLSPAQKLGQDRTRGCQNKSFNK